MLVFYCKKCKADSMTPLCERCGAAIPPQAQRFKWSCTRTPLGDTPTVLSALKIPTLVALAVALLLFLGEVIVSPDKQSALRMVTLSGMLPWLLILLAACMGIAILVLGLQGREERHFVVDARGAYVQTWIVPSRLKCLARFVPYDEYNIAEDPQGERRMLVGETHLLWADVARYETRRHACRIDLYRPAGFRFMSLYPAREEMQALEAFITPRMKHLARR